MAKARKLRTKLFKKAWIDYWPPRVQAGETMKINPCKCGGESKVYSGRRWFTIQCLKMSCSRLVGMITRAEAVRVWNFANPLKKRKEKAK